MRLFLPLALLVAFVPALAHATDGVFEINQACALHTGCFGGDAAAFPVTIDRPGSYRLTSNLLTGGTAVTAISITADGVSLDLNGFTIACAIAAGGGLPLACTEAGGGIGVLSTGDRTRVHDGIVTGMGGDGISVQNAAELRNLIVTDCGGTGVRAIRSVVVDHVTSRSNDGTGVTLTSDATLSNSVASRNGEWGFFVGGGGAVFTNNVAEQNGRDGFRAGNNATVTGNSAASNREAGILAGQRSTVTGNTVIGNRDGIFATGTISKNTASLNQRGIWAGASSHVSENSLHFNAGHGIEAGARTHIHRNTVRGSSDDAIEIFERSTVTENHCVDNLGAGIHATGTANRIDGNSVVGNDMGYDIDGIRNLIIRNSARNNTGGNYEIVAGNRVGAIVVAPLSGAISGDGPGGGTGGAEPWANFAY